MRLNVTLIILVGSVLLACRAKTPPAANDDTAIRAKAVDAKEAWIEAEQPDSSAPTPRMAAPAAIAPMPHRQRIAFAKKLAQIAPGTRRAQVEKLLGPPDDKRTVRDPGGINTTRTTEIWRYGTFGHLSFATLGTVYLMADDRVQYVFGGKGTPPPATLMEEAELRRLMRLLALVPSYNDGAAYNPADVIRAVNALQPLGKDKALAVIDEFLRVSSWFEDPGREGMFFVLRTLFDVPTSPGYMPAMRVGSPAPPPPSDPRLVPRFPIMIVDDVPFNLVSFYNLGGVATPPEMHVDHFRRTGVIRSHPLIPSATPLEMADALVGSEKTDFLQNTQAERVLIINQLLALTATVIHREPNQDGSRLGDTDIDGQWQVVLANAKVRSFLWSPSNQQYQFTDGTIYSNEPAQRYQREIWPLPLPGIKEAVVTLERMDSHFVRVEVRVTMSSSRPLPAASVALIDERGTELTRMSLGNGAGPMSASGTWSDGSEAGTVLTKLIALAPKAKIHIELLLPGGKPTKSPLLVP